MYDPCEAIDDGLVTSAGYDPASRKPDGGTYFGVTGVACGFQSQKRGLLVVSSDSSFDNFKRSKADMSRGGEPINGRDALVIYDPAKQYTCAALMRTNAGFVVVASTVQISYAYLEEPCDGIVELATLIEPTIGEGN